jgi:hypothetical protein
VTVDQALVAAMADPDAVESNGSLNLNKAIYICSIDDRQSKTNYILCVCGCTMGTSDACQHEP